MTFATNVQTDIDAIVGGEAKTSATYKPFGGGDVAVEVLFFEITSDIERRGRGARVYSRTARVYVSVTDVASATIQDRIEIAGELWNVRTPNRRRAWWELECVLSTRVDRSGAQVVE